MFCPACKDEYRPGFTRCATCDVALVEDLARVEGERPAARPADLPRTPVRLTDYCGFLSLDDARQARDLLRAERIAAEIVIREAPDADRDHPLREEYWIRAAATRIAEVERLLDEPRPAAPDEGELACSACGQGIAAEAAACSACGAMFEED